MTKSTYPTKYQLEHLKRRINNEIDPLIEQAQLSVKSIVADLTESAELKLAKKINSNNQIKSLIKAKLPTLSKQISNNIARDKDINRGRAM